MVKETKKLDTEKKTKRFEDVNEKIEFHNELDKVDFENVIGVEIEVLEAKLIRDFDGKFGKHDFMIIHFASVDPDTGERQEYTTGTSGMVLVKRIMTAQEKKQLPLVGVIAKPDGKQYYDIN